VYIFTPPSYIVKTWFHCVFWGEKIHNKIMISLYYLGMHKKYPIKLWFYYVIWKWKIITQEKCDSIVHLYNIIMFHLYFNFFFTPYKQWNQDSGYVFYQKNIFEILIKDTTWVVSIAKVTLSITTPPYCVRARALLPLSFQIPSRSLPPFLTTPKTNFCNFDIIYSFLG